MNDIWDGYRPGVLGELVALQTRYYAASHGFGQPFECKVAREMAAFLERLDPARDLFRTVWRGERLLGSLTLDASEAADGELAHLRWLFVVPEARDRGLARALLDEALAQARRGGKSGAYLTTIDNLEAAARLYRGAGFVVTETHSGESWGRMVTEVRMEYRFGVVG